MNNRVRTFRTIELGGKIQELIRRAKTQPTQELVNRIERHVNHLRRIVAHENIFGDY